MPQERLGRRALAVAIACGLAGACGGTLPPPASPDAGPSREPAVTAAPAQPGSGVSITGLLSTADKRPLAGATVILRPLAADGAPPLADVELGPDGTFAFRHVPPGRYEIRARGQTIVPQVRSLVATFGVIVMDRPVTNVQLVLIPGASIAGRVLVEAVQSSKPPSFAGLRIRAPFSDGSGFGDAVTGEVSPNGAFTIDGLIAGGHVISVEGLPDPWLIKSVAHRGRDITDVGIEVEGGQEVHDVRVTIADVAAEIAGLVLDGSGAGVAHATVVVVPPAPQFWNPTSRRIQVTRADAAGRYRVRGLPPGEYRIVASLDLEPTDVHGLALLQRLAAAGAPMTIRGVESRAIDVRLSPATAFRRTASR